MLKREDVVTYLNSKLHRVAAEAYENQIIREVLRQKTGTLYTTGDIAVMKNSSVTKDGFPKIVDCILTYLVNEFKVYTSLSLRGLITGYR